MQVLNQCQLQSVADRLRSIMRRNLYFRADIGLMGGRGTSYFAEWEQDVDRSEFENIYEEVSGQKRVTE